MRVRFLSVCSGLEGASLAAHPLGWVAAGVAEIEAFPSAIIAHYLGSNIPGERLSGNAPPNFGAVPVVAWILRRLDASLSRKDAA